MSDFRGGLVRSGRRHLPRSGWSLLELLVAVLLGLVLIHVLVDQVLASRQGQRLQAAQAQMIEDAQIALDLLRSDLRMAGHAWPLKARTGTSGLAAWEDALGNATWTACDAGFASEPSGGPPSCVAAPAGAGPTASAVELSYQVDAHSAVLGSDGRPTDCLGNAIEPTVLADGQQVYLAFNRWQVVSVSGRSELRCGGRGRTGPQPLVDHVERLLLWWGLPVEAAAGAALRYVGAAQVGDFTAVRAVRVCLQLRSADPVLGSGDLRAYRACDGSMQTSDDGRLRRSFVATVAWRHLRPS